MVEVGQVGPCTYNMVLVSFLQVTVQPGMILSDSLFGTAIFQGDNATGFAAGGGGEGAPAAGECPQSTMLLGGLMPQTFNSRTARASVWVRSLPAEALHSWAGKPPSRVLLVDFDLGRSTQAAEGAVRACPLSRALLSSLPPLCRWR